jgi:hypothetical protein
VDIGGIVDHHCLNSLFISLNSYPSQDVERMADDVNSELYRASPVTGNAEY